MDSLTQIVLGAACGEIALGKKIGNKALLFGAIGGTIPDLDVFTSRWFYSNQIDIMAAHRGFSHSIVFSILGAFIFGYIVYALYNTGKRKDTTKRTDWIWLFFLALATHILLDAFTPYGTQWFLPFSNYRVAFNNIAVVDLLYTLPFLIALLVLMFFKRQSKYRTLWLKIGLGISSFYMLLTLINKLYINTVFKKSLIHAGIAYERFQTQPSIFNNILWYGVAETKDRYYVGFYSLFDEDDKVGKWQPLPKNHNLVPNAAKDIKTLAWFSNGYYNFLPMEEKNTFRFNDLRYPLFNEDDPNSSVFSFTIYSEKGRWNAKPFEGKPPNAEDFNVFWKRLKGVKKE
ncbi:MAG TPA: metal-dependent hydrolase [Flavobacteriaceae bacterium]|nr:metal-dependent hydrolase [Flavobacteriaceae bacterium]